MPFVSPIVLALFFAITNAKAEDESIWRSRARCGVNCAYLFLKLHGYDVDYDAVLAHIPVSAAGSTMEDVRRYISSKGTNAVAIRATPPDLMALTLPVIAHVEPEDPEFFFVGERGHFVVVVGLSSETVTYIDGTTGAIHDQDMAEFVRTWSGRLIVVQGRSSRMLIAIVLMGSGLLTFLVVWVLRTRWHATLSA
jgi:ABC-type bacteriocin/lantibiotic exporter with double-glycine peptidase domain